MNSRKQVVCGMLAAALVLSSAASAPAWSGHRDGRGHLRGHVFVGHGPFVGPRVFFGPRVFVGPLFVGPAYYPPPVYYPAPVYAGPVVVPQETPAYAQSSGAPTQYWYYCPDNRTYYPYTQQCPSGWLQVVPSPAPPPSVPR